MLIIIIIIIYINYTQNGEEFSQYQYQLSTNIMKQDLLN